MGGGTTKSVFLCTRVGGGRSNSVCAHLKKWIVTLAKVIKGGVNKFLESYPLSGLIKGGRVEFRVKFFGEYLTNVGVFCSTSA